MKLLGVDVCKLLWFYRPDSNVAEHQREVIRTLVCECADLSLPLVVEPIWYPLEGENPKDEARKQRRVRGIVEGAHEVNALGVDINRLVNERGCCLLPPRYPHTPLPRYLLHHPACRANASIRA